MMRWSVLLANALMAFAVFAADELPTADPGELLEIEPPLLIGNRGPDGSIVVGPKGSAVAPADVDLARLESDLARARKSAASGERLYKGGIIAKVEAEERVLKVIRLEAKLADARLQEAKGQVETGKGSEESAQEVAQAEEVAARAAAERNRAEMEAALRNLQRQKKLLALGSGRKADVNRAEQKLAELQHPPN
jgi:hypothetical protein